MSLAVHAVARVCAAAAGRIARARWLCTTKPFLSAAGGASSCKALVFSKHGNPEDVVELQEWEVPELGAEDVAVEMIACPVNPSDVNLIQGVYAMKPSLPAVGGREGVGVVREVGTSVSTLRVGDWVIPSGPNMGTWRTKIVQPANMFLGVSQDIPVNLAATLAINPPTAYRMLKTIVDLKEGDCVIQNCANSGVGVSVIQLAAAWKLKTINVIRDRPEFEQLKARLVDLGATEVVTEEFSGSRHMSELIEKHGRPVLALNGVGGKSATNLTRQMAYGSTMVTYGGMARQPLTVSTGALIFKNLKFVGYWNGKWLENNSLSPEHTQMMEDLCKLGEEGKLRPPSCHDYPLAQYKTALSRAMEPFIASKQLIRMDQ